jgi:hypothetical protein
MNQEGVPHPLRFSKGAGFEVAGFEVAGFEAAV